VARRAGDLARHRQRHLASSSWPAIVAELPSAIAGTLELSRQGALSVGILLLVAIMVVAVIAFIVFNGARPAPGS